MSSESTNPLVELIKQIFEHIPKGLRGLIAVIVTLVVIAILIITYFPDVIKNDKKEECETVNIIGKIVDSKTRNVLKIKKINIEGLNLNPDMSISEGVFTLLGVKLPSHKLISLEIISQNNNTYETQPYDLSNKTRYPTINCNIDIGTIPIEIPYIKDSSKSLKREGIRGKASKATFIVTSQVNRELIPYLESVLDMKHDIINAKYRISFVETGQIVPVNADKSQYMYSGGEVIVKINDVECAKLDNTILDRTLPSGNDYYYVKGEILKQLKEKIDLQRTSIAQLIKTCIRK